MGKKMGRGTTPSPRHFAHTEVNSQTSFPIYPVPAKICKQSGTRPSHTPLSTMTSFNFQSIQSLEISVQDKPTIDVRDGHLVLTAERGEERIVITAPLQGIMPKVAATAVKKPKRGKISPLLGRSLHKGSDNGMAKLNDDLVREIRTLLADKSFVKGYKSVTKMYTEIAKSYNVSPWAIKNVAEGISWKHVIV
jgi:hypothetical protein